MRGLRIALSFLIEPFAATARFGLPSFTSFVFPKSCFANLRGLRVLRAFGLLSKTRLRTASRKGFRVLPATVGLFDVNPFSSSTSSGDCGGGGGGDGVGDGGADGGGDSGDDGGGDGGRFDPIVGLRGLRFLRAFGLLSKTRLRTASRKGFRVLPATVGRFDVNPFSSLSTSSGDCGGGGGGGDGGGDGGRFDPIVGRSFSSPPSLELPLLLLI